MIPSILTITENLFLFKSTCHVYILRHGDRAVLIDFGDGDVLDRLADLGIRQVSAILMTHHHRDQGQGLHKAVRAGISIWVPETERDLFAAVDWHWQGRNFLNNYNVRQDRFSLLQSVPIDGVLRDYEQLDFGGFPFEVVPTPGHTTGSISLLTTVDQKKVCFVGDLIAAPGKLWSLAATQWTYNGAEGVAYTVLSLLQLQNRKIDVLLPSHGEVMDAPAAAIEPLVDRLTAMLIDRGEHRALRARTRQPFQQVTEHVYRNLTSVANSYVVVSASGKALIVDYGYDFIGGLAGGADRASRRPWLYTLPALKELLAVTKIDAVLPTHYHDDHVAGINLLRRVEGAQVWAPENFADILADPLRFDLPCLWYDPIPVDVVLLLETCISWEEFRITLFALPGHTRYAVAILLEADGKRILFTGDQYQSDTGLIWNHVYQNRFEVQDYRSSANLYQSLRPDIILPGHWNPLYVDANYLQAIQERGETLEEHHRQILPLEMIDLGTEGFIGRLTPYQVVTHAGQSVQYRGEVTNPLDSPQTVRAQLVLPDQWQVEPALHEAVFDAHERRVFLFNVKIPQHQSIARRLRIALDLTIGEQPFGQQAEAMITLGGDRLANG